LPGFSCEMEVHTDATLGTFAMPLSLCFISGNKT
jgi:hypothetical protein